VLEHASVSIGDVDLFVNGVPYDERSDAAATVLREAQMVITVDLGTGGGHEAVMWTCDFSKEYVTINAEYRT
jgi:glutamate N-acetyltransferase/amino-acid N-acetyltransferase